MDRDLLIGALLDDACLTAEQLARACAVDVTWVVQRVEEGVLSHALRDPDGWRFSSRDLWRARQVRMLERDFEAVPELAALVTDLFEEITELRARLRRHERA